MRTLIFIVSYNAEEHIAKVLRDIPDEFKNSPETEILLIDDASSDKTVEEARLFGERNKIGNLKVFKNVTNQGYGGNQKLGYRYAVQEGFDVVAMLHGDWQYTPLALPALLAPFREDAGVDCVLGTRFGREHSPLAGGMPFYKYVGNRILTKTQNRLAGADLREWHTGYRVYRTSALAKIAFELNTNEFHFDTEILLQLLARRSRIVEVDIPTRYGDETCHVDGLRYAKDVLKAVLKYRLQQYNLFYDVRYHPEVVQRRRPETASDIQYGHKFNSHSPHSSVAEGGRLVSRGSKVLDIGCSTGYICQRLAERSGCDVAGVDMLPAAMMKGCRFPYLQADLEGDLESLNSLIERMQPDVVLMLDVLEHLSSPELFLLNLYRRNYRKSPKFLFSTGNVAFFIVRFMLLAGFFNYGNKGILDVTHKRLFSLRTFKNLLEQTGFIITEKHYFPFPFRALNFPESLARPLEKVNMWLIGLWPGLFAYQAMYAAVSLKTPELVLRDTLNNAAPQS